MPAQPTVIVIVGPTGIGKTAAAIRVAQALQTEIISSDSRQFFREMSIGTAKPTPQEQGAVRHHFIDFLSIHDDYSAGQFEREVLDFLNEWFKSHSTIVMAGGSGLYLNAVVKGFDELPADPDIRAALNKELELSGLDALKQRLAELDPVHFQAMDSNNPQRVIRALEVCLVAGTPYSELRKNATAKRNFRTLWIGLNAPREIVYERINQRVLQMVEAGLIEEARSLYPYHSLNALNTVGYKELFAHFDGTLEEAEAIAEIQKNTRNFAKRQMTWFKRIDEIHWFDYREIDRLVAFAVEQSCSDEGF